MVFIVLVGYGRCLSGSEEAKSFIVSKLERKNIILSERELS